MKTLQKFWMLLALPFLLLQACKKEEFEHPEVKTLSVVALSPAKIRVTGEITHKGNYKISDYGFIYSTNSYVTEVSGTKVSLGNDPSDGTISKDIPIAVSYYSGYTVYVRTYLTNEKGTAYGDVVSVQLPAISTSNISPTSGRAGDKVTINGNYSSLTKEDVKVTFGNINAQIESVAPSKIVVEVPTGISTSYYSNQVEVKLTVAGNTTSISSYFTIKPTFTDFSPKSGVIGSTIYISGTNLLSSYYSGSIKIYFGSIYTSSYSISSGNLVVTIPSGITTEKIQIIVEVDGIKTTLPGEYVLTPPTISSISPTTVWPGSIVNIYGSNLASSSSGYYNSAATILIGDITASNYSISATQASVYVPSSLPEGEHKVIVKFGPFSVEAPQKIKVKGMSFTGFSPASGASGKEITLTGEFNPNASYSVYFGSNFTSASSVTSTSMKVIVPGNLDAGDVKISIKSGSLTLTSNDNFTVLGPSITSISPTSGVAGSIVTITGTGFTPNTGYYNNNTVKFGTTNTPSILSATESTLRVLVPSNLTPGAMKISVTNSYGQTVVSPMNFTVTNQ